MPFNNRFAIFRNHCTIVPCSFVVHWQFHQIFWHFPNQPWNCFVFSVCILSSFSYLKSIVRWFSLLELGFYCVAATVCIIISNGIVTHSQRVPQMRATSSKISLSWNRMTHIVRTAATYPQNTLRALVVWREWKLVLLL